MSSTKKHTGGEKGRRRWWGRGGGGSQVPFPTQILFKFQSTIRRLAQIPFPVAKMRGQILV